MAPVTSPTKDSTNDPDSSHISIEGAVQETNQAPSNSDFDSPNSSDLVEHSKPPSQVNAPVDDEFGDSKEIPEGMIKNRVPDRYWDTVGEFASEISKTAKNVLSNRRPYFKRVVAVIAYWEKSTELQHLQHQADTLGKLLEDRFKFEALVYKIPDKIRSLDFAKAIGDELDKVREDRDSLFILYYGGHASIEEFTDVRLWKKENHGRSPVIQWWTVMRLVFTDAVDCSILFIFDCCHAGAMIDTRLTWDTSCELLGACGPDVQASALNVSSFTRAFCEEVSKDDYTILELHAALGSTEKRREYNLVKFPYYQDFVRHKSLSSSTLIKQAGYPGETENPPSTPSRRLARLEGITDMVVCIGVTFKCTAEMFMEEIEVIKRDWKRWFKFAPTECDDIIVKACRSTELIAAFNSSSCITIWSFPVWLWGAMAPLSDCQYIGIIRPQNLALPASSTQLDLAVPDWSSNMIVGEVSHSPLPSKPGKRSPVHDTILEGRTGDEDPHLESIKPIPATSTEAKATLKLPTKSLPQQPVQTDRVSRSHTRKTQVSSSRESSNVPLSFFNSQRSDLSRITVFDHPAKLNISYDPPSLVDFLDDPRDKRKASSIQRITTSKGIRNLESREIARKLFKPVF